MSAGLWGNLFSVPTFIYDPQREGLLVDFTWVFNFIVALYLSWYFIKTFTIILVNELCISFKQIPCCYPSQTENDFHSDPGDLSEVVLSFGRLQDLLDPPFTFPLLHHRLKHTLVQIQALWKKNIFENVRWTTGRSQSGRGYKKNLTYKSAREFIESRHIARSARKTQKRAVTPNLVKQSRACHGVCRRQTKQNRRHVWDTNIFFFLN